MITLRLFAQAREAAGTAVVELDAAQHTTLAEVLASARVRFGPGFVAVLETSRVWLNGDEPVAGERSSVHDGDEVAVIPPVSGGATTDRGPGD
ncbi:MAG TPA: MoaD/ThiS family protein [Acidimicrobiia bacterium]|nr:MoaD/ThiS family protein [Acidimicrobiia bacterium]